MTVYNYDLCSFAYSKLQQKLVSSREVDNTKTFDPDEPTGIKRLLLDMAEEYTKNLKKDKPSESSREASSK
jgi:hypothetical protein